MNWPNRITVLRILLVPVLVAVALRVPAHPGLLRVFLALVFVSAFTDALDGAVARLTGQRTPLGGILDPLADKMFLAACTVLLACPLWPWEGAGPAPRLPEWVAVVIVSRDLFLGLGSAVIYLQTGRLRAPPRVVGKITTVLQMALVAGALLPRLPAAVLDLLAAGAVAATLGSWALYLYDGARQLR